MLRELEMYFLRRVFRLRDPWHHDKPTMAEIRREKSACWSVYERIPNCWRVLSQSSV